MGFFAIGCNRIFNLSCLGSGRLFDNPLAMTVVASLLFGIIAAIDSVSGGVVFSIALILSVNMLWIAHEIYDCGLTWLELSVAGILINWLYHAVMESSAKQATLGKTLMKTQVTDFNGQRISFWKATARHFSKMLSTLILLVGFLMAIWTKNKQALHDKIAGCLVVRAGSAPAE